MRSQRKYIITKDEVHCYANDWLAKSLRLKYDGMKCTADTLLQLLLTAAARSRAELPKALFRTQGVFVPKTCSEIRRRPMLSTLRTNNHRLRKSRRIAIDLVLIPYHGHHHLILDLCHASEYVWSCAKSIHAQNEAVTAWGDQALAFLRDSGGEGLLNWLLKELSRIKSPISAVWALAPV